MTHIAILRDMVAKSRSKLVAVSRQKAIKRHFDIHAALDEEEKNPAPFIKKLGDEMTEQERIIFFLNEEYHEAFVWWHRHVQLLRADEKKGWG